ncbi:MAG: hypothetical protein JSS43_13510, partial [Proteobacteria bacterium]|nr:hypothetical protein [Pseudomonadota bacterium]
GTLATPGNWIETISVRNLSTQVTFKLASYRETGGPLAAGESRDRSLLIAWPTGIDSTGRFEFAVTVDSGDEVVEFNPSGSGESNNPASLAVVSAPDLHVETLAVQSPPQAGASLTITWNDRNTGNTAVPRGYNDRIVIYNQDTHETLLDTQVAQTAFSGASVARSFTTQLPDGLRGTGRIQISVTADAGTNYWRGAIVEEPEYPAEYDNASTIVVTAVPRPYPSLVAGNLQAPASGRGGTSVALHWEVTNNGQAGTGAATWSDAVVLSQDAIIGNSDDIVVARFSHSGALAIGEGYVQDQSVTLPTRLNGTYTLAIVSDIDGAVIEPDNNGKNIVLGTIAITAPYADLTVEAVAAPTSARSGASVDIAWRVRNLGDAATDAGSGGWIDRVVLAQGDTPGPNDIVLAEVARTAALGANGTYTGKATVTIPDTVTGTFKVLVITDAAGAVYEKGLTSNNIGRTVAPMIIKAAPAPDLQVQSVSGPTGGVPGQAVDITVTIANVGEAAARAPWVDRLYLSPTTTLAGAMLLGTVQRSFDLDPGQSYSVHLTGTLPVIADGSYFFVVRTDDGQQVYEAGIEANNIGVPLANNTPVPLALTHPDLTISVVGAPTTPVQSGQDFTVTWRTENTGTGVALAPWTETVVLSRDGVRSNDDIVLGTFDAAAQLAAGAGIDRSLTVTTPLGADGAWQILVIADTGNTVAETNAGEGNNLGATALQVSIAPFADLAVSDVTAPTLTVDDPATVTVGWRVTNIGTGAGRTGDWTDVVVASPDAVFGNGDDVVLGRFAHSGALATNGFYTQSQQITLPPGFLGRFHLFVESDVDGVVFQNGQRANDLAQAPDPFDITPVPYADLIVTSVTPTSAASSGQDLTLSWSVKNQGIGLTNVSQWQDLVYLSATPDFSSGVTYLGSFNHLGFIAPDGTYTREATVHLPDGISGTYYLQVRVPGTSYPYGGAPYEFIYTANNSGTSAAFTVALTPAPDLKVTTVTLPSTAQEGSAIDVTWTVTNQGLGVANGSWVDRVFLHKVGDPGPGTAIGSFTFDGPLEAGKSYTRRETIILPSHTSDGYEAIVVTDANGNLYEGPDDSVPETNNRAVTPDPVLVTVLPRPDIQVASIVAPDTIDAGASGSVRFTIINQGPVATTIPHWTDNVYLSLDDKITSDDILIGSYQNGAALNDGTVNDGTNQYTTIAGDFVVPLRFRGDVYIIVQTDSGGSMDEWPNDGNNIQRHKMYVNPAPFADLMVDNVVTPALSFEGNQVTLSYTVTNRGPGITDKGAWAEQVWLTVDKHRPNPSKGDVLLTTLQYNGGVLTPGQGYDRTVTVQLPDHVRSGTYYLTPWVDPYATLLEDTLAANINPDDPHEVNNNNYKAGGGDIIGFKVIGTPAPLPDLAVVAVNPAPTGIGGDNYDVSWTITNTGPGTADGWSDHLYLSTAPVRDFPGAKQWDLGRFERVKALAQGESYTNTQTIRLNPAASGLYLIVVAELNSDTDQTDNAKSSATAVVARAPDLRVTDITPDPQAYSGEQTTIQYTVTNTGADQIWAGTQYWTDQIWISRDATFIRNRATLVASLQQAGNGLAGGASYTRSLDVALPPGIGGTYYVYVFTDVWNAGDPTAVSFPVPGGDNAGALNVFTRQAFEDPRNNMLRATLPVIYREPDLRVTDIVVPSTRTAGSTLDISFTVTNVGSRATREDSWFDRLYLSIDPSLDDGDYQLGLEKKPGQLVAAESQHVGILAAGASYVATIKVTLPFEINGAFNLLAMTDSAIAQSGFAPSSISPRLQGVSGDATGRVREFQGEGNNVTARSVQITPYVAPDLVVGQVIAPTHAIRNQTFTVSYTVTNQGGDTPALQSSWDDLVYLSRDPFLDLRADRYVGSFHHDGGLAAGGHYDQVLTLTVPGDLATQAYYVFVITDPARTNATGTVFEANERNNDDAADVPMIIDLPPPTDLQVDSIDAPANARAGEPLHVSWTVGVHGTEAASGTWADAVYLSRDATWDITDIPLGRVSFNGTVAPNGTYTLALDTTMPGVEPGDYRVIVRTDIFNQVFEGANEVNNMRASADAVTSAVDTLTLGVPLTTTLVPGQERLYKITVGADQTLRLKVNADNDTSINQVFIRYDRVPTSALFDATYTGPLASDLTALVPSTKPGTYYVLLRGFSGPTAGTSITLLAEQLPLVITDVKTDRGGDGKYVTTTITGARFSQNAVVKLVRPGVAEYEPANWQVVNNAEIIATWDLTGAPHGLYDLVVTNPDGSQAIIPYRFLVERAIDPEVTIGIGGPRIILAGDQATYSVALLNQSNLDAPYTYFQVGVPQLNVNPIVYGLPYLKFYTNLRGEPDNLAGSANASVPYTQLESITNTTGQLTASGWSFDQPADGFGGFTFNVETYPGLKEMHDRAFEEFRAKMAQVAPELDSYLANGAGGLDAWWEAFKEKAADVNPAFKGILDQLDFVGMYNQNAAVPDECVIPFIPFRFHVFGAATSMNR